MSHNPLALAGGRYGGDNWTIMNELWTIYERVMNELWTSYERFMNDNRREVTTSEWSVNDRKSFHPSLGAHHRRRCRRSSFPEVARFRRISGAFPARFRHGAPGVILDVPGVAVFSSVGNRRTRWMRYNQFTMIIRSCACKMMMCICNSPTMLLCSLQIRGRRTSMRKKKKTWLNADQRNVFCNTCLKWNVHKTFIIHLTYGTAISSILVGEILKKAKKTY